MATCETCGHPIKYYGHLLGGYRCDNFCNQGKFMPKSKTMKPGKTQAEVLKCLREHGWYISGDSGWAWGTQSQTKRILDALVKKGAASMSHERPYTDSAVTRDVYRITFEGVQALEVNQ